MPAIIAKIRPVLMRQISSLDGEAEKRREKYEKNF